MSKKRQRLSAEERRRQILESTYKLIVRKGFKSITTRAIAADAGINEALIFKYFNTKENLLTSIVEYIKKNRPGFDSTIPESKEKFFVTLKQFEKFFLKQNCSDPSLLKIILYAILENYPIPAEFNFNSGGTFLNWIYNTIEYGKLNWDFNQKIDTFEAICIFMGSLIYYALETGILKYAEGQSKETQFAEMLLKVLQSNNSGF